MSGWQIPTPQEIGLWFAAVGTGAMVAFRVWRSKAKTGLDNSKDAEEGAGIKFVLAQMRAQNAELRAERDAYKQEAHDAWVQQRIDAAEISGLKARGVQMELQVQALREQVAHLQSIITRHLPPDATNPLPRTAT